MLPDGYTDSDGLLDELDNDMVNGKYAGWLYTQDITLRDFRTTITATYVTVDSDYIHYWKNPGDALPLKSFKTARLKWTCTDQSAPCSPTDYIKALEDKLKYDAKQNLLRTILTLVG